MELKETFQKVKAASKTLGLLTDEQRNEVLQAVADAIIAETPALLLKHQLQGKVFLIFNSGDGHLQAFRDYTHSSPFVSTNQPDDA